MITKLLLFLGLWTIASPIIGIVIGKAIKAGRGRAVVAEDLFEHVA